MASLVAQIVKNLSEMQEIWVWSLGCEDTLEKGMVTHSNSLAWRIPWTEEPGWLQSMGSQSRKQLSDLHTQSYRVILHTIKKNKQLVIKHLKLNEKKCYDEPKKLNCMVYFF